MMVKKSLKQAIGISVGTAIGGVLLPRLLFPDMFNETYPPIWKQMIIYLAVAYIGSFLVFLLINWIKAKVKPE